MLVVPGRAGVGDRTTCRRDLAPDCYRGVPTYSCCSNAGSLWDATDRIPIVGTFLLASRGSRIGLDCSARATRGLVAGASYDDRLYVLSPGDGEVIWKGSGGGESASESV
jgi:hypothetical protein